MPLTVLSLERRIRDTEGLVETLRHEAKMQPATYTSEEQDHNAAVFRMHEFETRVTLLSDENCSLMQADGIYWSDGASLDGETCRDVEGTR